MAVERWTYQPIRRGGSYSWVLARAVTALLVLLGAAVVGLVVWHSDPGSKVKLDANAIASPFDVSGGPPPCPPRDAIRVTDLARSAVAATAPTAGGQAAPRSYSRIHFSHRSRWRLEPVQEVVAIEHNWPRSRPSACSVEEPQTGENAGFPPYRKGLVQWR